MSLKSSTDSVFSDKKLENGNNNNKFTIGNFESNASDFSKISEVPSESQKLNKSKIAAMKNSIKSPFSDSLKNKKRESKNEEYSRQSVIRPKVSVSPLSKPDPNYTILNKDVTKKIIQQIKNVKV